MPQQLMIIGHRTFVATVVEAAYHFNAVWSVFEAMLLGPWKAWGAWRLSV